MRSYVEGSPGRTYDSGSTEFCKPYLFSVSTSKQALARLYLH
ncbi:hypothetical protein LMG28727_01746 [Paraburkholderia kirstenboschensis]|nr:hypothetical protein LMG28727_01746 [Paraburkholderia kirstenboschensis]